MKWGGAEVPTWGQWARFSFATRPRCHHFGSTAEPRPPSPPHGVSTPAGRGVSGGACAQRRLKMSPADQS